jgi:hypothetical protein
VPQIDYGAEMNFGSGRIRAATDGAAQSETRKHFEVGRDGGEPERQELVFSARIALDRT